MFRRLTAISLIAVFLLAGCSFNNKSLKAIDYLNLGCSDFWKDKDLTNAGASFGAAARLEPKYLPLLDYITTYTSPLPPLSNHIADELQKRAFAKDYLTNFCRMKLN